MEKFRYLKLYIKLLYAGCVKSEPKATNTNLIREEANNIRINVIKCKSIGDTILNHMPKAPIQNVKIILICGSLFLTGDFAMEND